MDTVKTIKEVRQKVREWRADGLTIGLVPTMGFLHEGHRSLIERAAAENDRVIVSDFVNPTQFGAGEDLINFICGRHKAQNRFPAPTAIFGQAHQEEVVWRALDVLDGLCELRLFCGCDLAELDQFLKVTGPVFFNFHSSPPPEPGSLRRPGKYSRFPG